MEYTTICKIIGFAFCIFGGYFTGKAAATLMYYESRYINAIFIFIIGVYGTVQLSDVIEKYLLLLK